MKNRYKPDSKLIVFISGELSKTNHNANGKTRHDMYKKESDLCGESEVVAPAAMPAVPSSKRSDIQLTLYDTLNVKAPAPHERPNPIIEKFSNIRQILLVRTLLSFVWKIESTDLVIVKIKTKIPQLITSVL